MPWYQGPTLLEHLETVPIRSEVPHEAMRFPVQYVVRPDADFRGFAGQCCERHHPAGRYSVGTAVAAENASPVDRHLRRRRGGSVLSDVRDAHLGGRDRLEPRRHAGLPARSAACCQPISTPWWCGSTRSRWCPAEAISSSMRCGLSRAKATSIEFRVDMNTLERNPTSELKMNDIGAVRIRGGQPAFLRSL